MAEQDSGEVKTPLQSKTFNFNSLSGILVAAVWPFLPEEFRKHDFAAPAVAAWFAIGNIIIRRFTSEAMTFFKRKDP